MSNKTTQKKRAYGYMSCMILMFAMVSTYPGNISNHERVIDNNVTIPVSVRTDSFKSVPSQTKRVYKMGEKMVTVDISKPGWAVDLLLSESKTSN